MIWHFILRLSVAGALGAIIGLDREYRAKEAGFRTHFLVALGSALIMIVSQYGFMEIIQNKSIVLDPSRIAAQVVSGIGFIGAGTIIIQKQFVRGLTTAAGLWATAAIGLAAGAGMHWLAISAAILTLIGLEGLSYVFKSVGVHNSLLVFRTTDAENLKKITEEISRNGHHIVSYITEEGKLGDTTIFHINMVLKTRKYGDDSRMFQFIQSLPNLIVERME